MDIHQLRTFVAVVQRASFSAAARDLGYTQSAVSQHVAALEASLGAVLLQRRPVVPTQVGVRLMEHAGPLLLRWDAARVDIARLTADPPARVVVGMSPLASWSFASLPDREVTVRVLPRAKVVAEVAAGTIDVGLVDGVAAPTDPLNLPDVGPLVADGVTAEPLVVALPSFHPLAPRKGLRLVDLADAHWISAPDVAIPLVQLSVVAGTDGFRASITYDGTDVRTLLALVAAGRGLALLPRSVADGVPLVEPRLVHRTEVVHSTTLDGPPAELVATLSG